MEVEVKIRLLSKQGYDALEALLQPGFQADYSQENFFFDGSKKELSAQRVVLRLRFYNKDEKAIVTLKGKAVVQDGISRSSEVEEAADPAAARAWLQDPQAMVAGAPLVQQTAKQHSIEQLVSLGGFFNRRKVYGWEGHTIELDETQFEWGTVYEVECETDQPEALRAKLEALLKGAGIEYRYSTVSKFANFKNKTLD